MCRNRVSVEFSPIEWNIITDQFCLLWYKNRKCQSDQGIQGNKQVGRIDLYTPKNILPVNLLCPMDDWFVEVVIKLQLDETQKRQLHKLNMITMSEQ